MTAKKSIVPRINMPGLTLCDWHRQLPRSKVTRSQDCHRSLLQVCYSLVAVLTQFGCRCVAVLWQIVISLISTNLFHVLCPSITSPSEQSYPIVIQRHGPLSRHEKLVNWISFGNRRDIEDETK